MQRRRCQCWRVTDKSLIRLNAAGRYDLHELLRQYAAEKLEEAGEAVATANRHLDYFLKLAEQAEAHQYGSEQPAWMDRVEEEVDNVRAALSWSLEGGAVEQGLILTTALRSFWEYRGHMRDGDAWTERLLDAAQGASPHVRAKALVCAGELHSFVIHDQGTLLFTEALVIARQIDDQAAIARALSGLAYFTSNIELQRERDCWRKASPFIGSLMTHTG